MPKTLCPSCKAPIARVQPVRIDSDPDSPKWLGRAPTALGFICPHCNVLLPLSPAAERDEG